MSWFGDWLIVALPLKMD